MPTHDARPQHPDRLILLGGSAALFLAILALETMSLLMAFHSGAMVSVWTANGLAAGVLVSVPRRHWLMLVLIIAAALATGQRVALGSWRLDHLVLLCADLAEILIVAVVIRRHLPVVSGEASGYLHLGRVVTVATLLGCVASTSLASLGQHLVSGGAPIVSAQEWFRAHLLGMVIVGMLTLVAFRERGRMLGPRGRRLRMLRDMLLLLAITVVVFAQTRYPLLFVVFAPLLYVVFQYRFPGLVIGVAIVTLVTNVATTVGIGPVTLIPTTRHAEPGLVAQVFLGVVCMITVPVALALADRQRLASKVAVSENLYRLLADYATDLIVRIASDGSRRYVSPSVKDMLGWTPEEFARHQGELIHPDDRRRVLAVITRLRELGKATIVRYRVRNRAGGYQWIESLGKLAPSPDRPGEVEIVYTGRDITERVLAEEALADSEKRLRTITDNIPAVIAHVDAEQRYTFVNGYVSSVIGVETSAMIGRTIGDVRGPKVYALLKPHIELVLKGTTSTFEYEADYGQRHYYFQATYLPAVAANGDAHGFYTLTTDITRIKRAEQQLDFLAHHDALTGIANRRSFRESINTAVRQAALTHEPLLLLMVDVDHFKQINDTYGHAAGDIALTDVATRLKASIRKTDLVARLGGDEFVILCHGIEDLPTAQQLAQKITDAMQPPVSLAATALTVSLSIGAALCRNMPSADALVQRADEALYQAKKAGRARYRVVADDL